MTLAAGMKLGPYEVLAPLGAGGMGEVYRARDVRVDRAVALKVLPEEFFESEERRGRFEREARMLASLNHPGIAVLYSFEEIPSSSPSSSRHLLAMELVEGEGLDARISSGPLSLEESLSFSRQIAEALEAAHEKGIIHRDLKPANVRVTHEGRVKLLDFGLAKMFEGDGGPGTAPSVTHSPTLTARATAAGVILGTAAYMSPEQARGKPVDKRTDVWAFGCVLFEMLTGKRAFEGETVSDTLAAVLMKEPDWAALPEQTPGKIRDLLRKCLRREAKQRLHDIADARLELEELGAPGASGSFTFEDRDGRELFYLKGGKLTSVPIRTGTTFEKGTPVELFQVSSRRTNIPQYDVFPDGRSFIVNTVVTEKAATPLTLVQNWTSQVKSK
jgi:serine/threonine protein kinase